MWRAAPRSGRPRRRRRSPAACGPAPGRRRTRSNARSCRGCRAWRPRRTTRAPAVRSPDRRSARCIPPRCPSSGRCAGRCTARRACRPSCSGTIGPTRSTTPAPSLQVMTRGYSIAGRAAAAIGVGRVHAGGFQPHADFAVPGSGVGSSPHTRTSLAGPCRSYQTARIAASRSSPWAF